MGKNKLYNIKFPNKLAVATHSSRVVETTVVINISTFATITDSSSVFS